MIYPKNGGIFQFATKQITKNGEVSPIIFMARHGQTLIFVVPIHGPCHRQIHRQLQDLLSRQGSPRRRPIALGSLKNGDFMGYKLDFMAI